MRISIHLLAAASALSVLSGVTGIEAQDRESEKAQDLERRVKERGRTLSALLATDPLGLEEVQQSARELLEDARTLAERQRRDLSAGVPALREWLADRLENPLTVLREAPIILFSGSTELEVIRCWKAQLRGAGRAIRGILDEDPPIIRDWLYWQDREGARKVGQPYFRTEQIRDCAREVLKLGSLLRLPRKIVPLRRARTVFNDDFASGVGSWKVYGKGEVSVKDGKLWVKGEGISVWCEKDFGDAAVSFDFTPMAGEGGALFAFPATPRPGKGYEASSGAMENYNRGIETYHVSLCRGKSGLTNLRRTGTGLKMLSSVEPDPSRTLGKTYRVDILVYQATIQVLVDGRLIHSYFDAGCFGAPLRKGRFGLRHFSGDPLECAYGKFRVDQLE